MQEKILFSQNEEEDAGHRWAALVWDLINTGSRHVKLQDFKAHKYLKIEKHFWF